MAAAPDLAPEVEEIVVREPLTSKDLRFDLAMAAGLFVAAVISVALAAIINPELSGSGSAGWSLVFGALMTLPLALRRRFPITVAFAVCLAYFVSVSLETPEWYASQVALFIAIYTIGAWTSDRRRAQLSRIVIIIAMFGWLLISTFVNATSAEAEVTGALTPYVALVMLSWLINVAYFGGAYYLGDRAWKAARQHGVLLKQTRELEAQRELNAAQAVALDRVRIARELHDVVAHHVSAMGVQAGAARLVLDSDPAAARSALTVIEESSRSAISELHQLLGTLRSSDPDPDLAATAPSTLGLDRLAALAETMTASGTPTEQTIVGEPYPVPDLVQVNLYRIAQEALTNVRRHAGPDATAEIRLRFDPDRIELEVTNTGRIALTSQPGLGHLGMRERAIASGGVLEVAPRRQGGYLVRVGVPRAWPETDGLSTASTGAAE